MFPDNTDAEKMAADLWAELRPLYLQLHAYVRHRLRQMYGNDTVGTDGTIPAHLLGKVGRGGGEGERGRERYRLKYDNDMVGTDGTIPAHLLGKVGRGGGKGRGGGRDTD